MLPYNMCCLILTLGDPKLQLRHHGTVETLGIKYILYAPGVILLGNCRSDNFLRSEVCWYYFFQLGVRAFFSQ